MIAQLAAAAVSLGTTLGGTAGPAAFSLTASPPAIHAAPGTTQVITVTDGGVDPLRVVATARSVASALGQCQIGSAVPGVTIRPATFRLRPGASRHVRVILGTATAGSDDAVIFTSAPLRPVTTSSSTGGSVNGAVGVQVVTREGAQPCGHHAAALPPARHGDPLGEGAGIAALLVLAAGGAGAVYWRRRQRHPGAHASGSHG